MDEEEAGGVMVDVEVEPEAEESDGGCSGRLFCGTALVLAGTVDEKRGVLMVCLPMDGLTYFDV